MMSILLLKLSYYDHLQESVPVDWWRIFIRIPYICYIVTILILCLMLIKIPIFWSWPSRSAIFFGCGPFSSLLLLPRPWGAVTTWAPILQHAFILNHPLSVTLFIVDNMVEKLCFCEHSLGGFDLGRWSWSPNYSTSSQMWCFQRIISYFYTVEPFPSIFLHSPSIEPASPPQKF